MLLQTPVEPHILIKHRQLGRKDVQPKVSFAHAIYHTSKHFCACVDACVCDRMPLLKRLGNVPEKTCMCCRENKKCYLESMPKEVSNEERSRRSGKKINQQQVQKVVWLLWGRK